MLQAVRALDRKKKMEKWSHLSSFHVFFLSYGPQIVQKSAFFFNFVLISAINPIPLEQITYMHLKFLITLFQKMIWFIEVSAIVHEILAIKISKTIVAQQKFNKILQLQTLSQKQCIINNTIF